MLKSNTILYILSFVCLTICFFLKYYSIIDQGLIFGPFKDNTYIIGPTLAFISNSVKSFSAYPLWNPNIFYGMPLFDNAMLSSEYPFLFLKSIEYDSPTQALRNFTSVTILHIYIWSIGNFLLGKFLKFNYSSSIAMGLTTLIFLSITRYTSWGLNIMSLSWFPYLLIALIGIFLRKNKLLFVLAISILSLFITAKPSQPFIQISFCSAILILGLFFQSKEKIKSLLYLALSGILSLLLSAKAFLPAMLEITDKLRWVKKGRVLKGNEPLLFDDYSFYMPFENISEVVLTTNKMNFGPGHIYIGPIILILSLYALYTYFLQRPKEKKPYIIIVSFLLFLYAFLSCFDGPINLTSINMHIPLINKIRQPIRNSLIMSMVLPILMGYGLHNMFERKKLLEILFVLIPCVCILTMQIDNSKIAIISSLLVTSLIGIALYVYKKRINTDFVTFIFIPLLVVNAVIVKNGIVSNKDSWTINTPKDQKSHEILTAIKDVINTDFDRITFKSKMINNGEWAMNSNYYNIRSFSGNFAPISSTNFFFRNSGNRANYRKTLGAKYTLLGPTDKIPSNQKLTPVQDHTLALDNSANDWCYIANRVVRYSNEKNFFAKIRQNYRKATIYLDQNINAEIINQVNNSTVNKSNQNKIIGYDKIDNETFSINTNLVTKSTLVICELYSTHWKILNNGKEIDYFKANRDQIGMILPEGLNEITIQFKPQIISTLNIARYISLIGLLIIIAFLLKSRFTQTSNERV